MSLAHQEIVAGPARPDDNPTPDELVARARAMRDRIRELQGVHAQLGTYSEEIHNAFTEARLYDILRPRMFGGLELGLETFFRVVTEIARADPAVGWSFELGASHPYQFSSYFPERAQREVYENTYPFVSASRAFALQSTVELVDGGYKLSGRWDYNSGCTWSSHFMPVAPVIQPDGSVVNMMFIVPREAFTILDDWGFGRTTGLHASSSNSITMADVFVPDYCAVPFDFKDRQWGETGSNGYQLHKNPLYLGRSLTVFIAGLAVTQIGAAWAALDEYEYLLKTKATSFPPRVPRTESAEFQLWYGKIMSLTESADTLLRGTLRDFEAANVAWTKGGPEFTSPDDARLRGRIVQAAIMAGEAIDLAVTTAGTSSSGMIGTKLEKYSRDAAMYRTHIGAQFDVLLASGARFNLGQPLTM